MLFEAAQRVAVESSNDLATQRKTLMSMVFPVGAPPDSSPLHVVCCNDTCSFTWTGAEHINQVRKIWLICRPLQDENSGW